MNRIERRMLFPTCALNEGKIYAFTSFGNIPIKIDLECEEILCIKDMKNYQVFYADEMLSDEDNIFALELNGSRMLRYNIKENECYYYEIDCGKKGWGNYAISAIYERILYIFPVYSDALVKVNLNSGKIQKDGRMYSKINKYEVQKGQETDLAYFSCGCVVGSIVWLFQENGTFAVAYNMALDAWQEYKLSVKINHCVHVAFYAGRLYLLSSEGKIYSWDMQGEFIEEIADCSNADASNNEFERIVLTDKRIFVLPALGKDIFCIDLNTGRIEKYESYPDDFHYCSPEGWSKYYGYCEDENQYYYAMRSMRFMLSIDKRSGKEKWLRLNLPTDEEYKDLYQKYNKGVLSESVIDMQEMLKSGNLFLTTGENVDLGMVGAGIWDRVK